VIHVTVHYDEESLSVLLRGQSIM